jgi:transposase
LREGGEDRISDPGGSGEVWREETVVMPRPYSADLRGRVLVACERREGSREEIARRFRVAASTLYAWLKLARETGRRAPKPHDKGQPPVGGEAAVLAELVAARNDATLAEYADLLAGRTGIRRSPSALSRALRALGLVRKKRRSGRPSRTARMSPRRAKRGGRSWPGLTPGASSSSTRPASTPA